MDENKMSILDLNTDCLLQIMKFIIDDCKLRNKSRWMAKYTEIYFCFRMDHKKNEMKIRINMYADIEAFAMAHENIKELLRIYFKEIYYHRELTMLSESERLTIDFAQIQSQIVNQNEGDAYWKLYTKALRENTDIHHVELIATPESPSAEFTKHFQMITYALENKRRLEWVSLTLNAYSLVHWNMWEKLTHLYLDARISSEALVSVCQSSPGLLELQLRMGVDGRLSDIVPHCGKLERLEFVPKPDNDGAEYAPLAKLPNLGYITIRGAFTNGSHLTMVQALKNWERTRLPLTVHFAEELPHLSSVEIATNSLQSIYLTNRSPVIELKAYYNFLISKDNSPLEKSLATINHISASFKIDWTWRTLTLFECPTSDSNIRELISQLKQFNINGLIIPEKSQDKSQQIAKLFRSMVPDRLLALKSICINCTEIDRLTACELVRIKSITFLKCILSDWETVDLLGELTNLETLDIAVEKKFDITSSRALCNLLNICKVCATISCKDWRIELKKNEKVSGPNNDIAAPQILNVTDLGSLSQLFEAFEANEVHAVKKLEIASDANGIEELTKLTELEELIIIPTGNGSMVKIFDQLATKGSPSIPCLKVIYTYISQEEEIKIMGSAAENCASLEKLVNSNIEKFTFSYPFFSMQKILATFAAKTTNRLQHLEIMNRKLDLMELEELSKLKDLRSLRIESLNLETLPFLQNLKQLEELFIKIFRFRILSLHLPSLKKLSIRYSVGLGECQCLADLENLESLNLWMGNRLPSDYCNDHILAVAESKNLKELHIRITKGSLKKVYHAFASKSGLKLTHLSAMIVCVEELNEITRIESLQELHLRFYTKFEAISGLGQLTKLQSLYIDYRELHSVFVLPILESCKNINRCTIRYRAYMEENFVRKVHSLLKSIRDPAVQAPLTLTILNQDLFYDSYYQLEYLDDAYMKVYYSYKIGK